MKMFPVTLAFALACASVHASEVTPVQKVIELLNGMAETGRKEKQDEQVNFAAYQQFCDDTTMEKERRIKEADEKIEMLKATIKKLDSDIKRLSKEIAVHDEDIAVWTGDEESARRIRKMDEEDNAALHKDYSESIDALQRAIAVLNKHAGDTAQSASLLQLSQLSLIPSDALKTIDAFLQGQVADDGVSAPEANAYEFQSHGVIEMLGNLLDKFIGERIELEKKEAALKQRHELLMQDLAAQIDQATQDRNAKAASKAKKLQSKADAEGDLKETAAQRKADKEYLDNLTATCKQKSHDFASRQKLRTEELAAIDEAIKILSSDAVSGNADKHLPAMLQAKHSSFAMLRSDAQGLARSQAVEFLQKQAARLNSRVLHAVAESTNRDPFKKVKKMIKDLIARLQSEANEESEHKGWCDSELSVNEQTRREKTVTVETLYAQIDQLEAAIAKLTEEIADLNQAVTELDKAMAKATTLRQAEKEENTATIADAKEAQVAVAQALTILKEFYAKASEATALVQQEPPKIFETAYKGMQSEKGGVVGMLEVIETDFSRLESDTTQAEAAAVQTYKAFMAESKADKDAKEKEIEDKTFELQDTNQEHTETKNDLEHSQKELDAALAYFDKLKPSCIDVGVEYKDRVARRQEEIESLQEALKILGE